MTLTGHFLVINPRFPRTIILIIALAFTFWWPFRAPVTRFLFGVPPGVTLHGESVSGLTTVEVEEKVRQLAEELNQEAKNASIDRSTGQIIPEKWGVQVDIQATVNRVMSAAEGARVEPVLLDIEPEWKAQDLKAISTVLGSFTTWMQGSSARRYNIRLSASFLDRTLVLPGEEFSFNALASPYTRERGYQDAPIIDDTGRMSPGIGGGICQVSTTLYNAIVEAGLKLTERHRHTLRIYYVTPGKDAAVAHDKDLRFVNNRTTPVLVRVYADEKKLTAEILGTGN